MPALNFKKQFAPKIISGEKRQTIRATRKYQIKKSDHLYLYTGMRTRQCTKLAESTCIETKIFEFWWDANYQRSRMSIEGTDLTFQMAQDLAVADGFDNLSDFIDFFIGSPKAELLGNGLLFFSGQIIEWGIICKP